MHFFRKVEVGRQLRDFDKQVGIPNELHFDRAAEQMGKRRKFQCAL